ncbi:flagellar biosynthesis protein FlgL [Epibacterium sp. SM1979]|uniref:Flagellar biosynthesis protein FlgL n=1 Tax=Tritonibacter litoralis TaxID=2662264 RepID=A0A843YHC3_9RHOB|nr:flagellin [Tritonibacter litoralis]MQQ08167.1 flagellar biosynthesis protein FlgL [Tritonibacter litoralis]
MISTSYGDLAQYTFLRIRNSTLKSEVQTLGQELTTGRTTNVTERLGGDFTYLAGIEHTLSQLDSYQVAAAEVTVLTVSIQSSLENVENNVQGLRDDILALSSTMSSDDAERLAGEARAQLGNTIDTLNSTVGGRALFAGTATQSAALENADVLMSALAAEVAGAATVDDVVAAVDNWFDDPAGFDSVVYAGSTTPLAPIDVGDGDEVQLDVLASDDAFKKSLKAFALAALTVEPGVTLPADSSIELVRRTGTDLFAANDAIIDRRSDVGFIEERIENSRTRNEAEITSLSITKNEMLEADPYETYAKLEEAQNQLESLYVVTQRSFQLTLLRYIS